jgi:hypothetical protein
MTSVSVYSYTHSVYYVADNILKSFKDVIRLSGLSPEKLVSSWQSNLRAIKTWLESKHLERVVLEVYDPNTDKLVVRWDLDIQYSWTSGDGTFWTDTDQLRYHILKAGVVPQLASYRILLHTKPNEPPVEGWGPTSYRSTDGMVKQSLGSTIQHSGLGADGGYWRRG